jgi:hypothetical protein
MHASQSMFGTWHIGQFIEVQALVENGAVVVAVVVVVVADLVVVVVGAVVVVLLAGGFAVLGAVVVVLGAVVLLAATVVAATFVVVNGAAVVAAASKAVMHSAGPSVHEIDPDAMSSPGAADHFVQLPPVERAQTFVPAMSQV